MAEAKFGTTGRTMFTGIITDVGEVAARLGGVFTIRSHYDPATIALGASIAHDGCCLTVTSIEPAQEGCTDRKSVV